MLSNTVIPFIWIKQYFRDYQILLENIADCLIDKTLWWVEEDSHVKILDLSEIVFSKPLHHFRSSTIKIKEDFTDSFWEKGLDNKNALIPAYKIVINNQKVFLNTLHYFKNLVLRNKEPLSNSSKILLTVQENVGSVSTSASADTGGSFV